MTTALIIEDEVDLCRLLSLHLATLGIQNEFVHSVRDAKSCLIGGNIYDLIFLDMKLGDGNGSEILLHIRANSPQQKVVVVSGCDIERKNAFDHGALFFMAKPFTRQNIEHVIRTILHDK